MLALSSHFTKLSGSLAGTVGSHNRGGMYLRSRTTPTNPGSSFQQTVRNYVSQLSTAWSATLTQAQRDAWGVYAANQALTNRLGEAKNVTGLDMYVRTNVSRLQAGLSNIAAAPTVYTLPTFTITSVAASAATDLITITYPAGDLWTGNGGALFVYASRPYGVGINFFKGPYRFADSIDGAAVAPTSPQTVPAPFPLAAGQVVFTMLRASNPDGRLSAEQRFRTVVAA